MANPIEQLNFDVILKDDKFNATVNTMLSTAKKFNSDLSSLFDITAKIKTKDVISSKGVTNAQEMLGYLGQISEKIDSLSGKKMLVGDADALNETLTKVLDKLDKMAQKGESAKKGFSGINTELTKSQGLMSELSKLTGVAFGVAGLRSFLTGLVRISGEFEVQKMALTSMLQSADKADEIFNTLRKSALESPYTFQDLTKYAKQLTAFNIDADQLVETEKRLADVAAGLGVDMGRIILAYGQVKAAGVLKGTELRQFTEAGVPLLQSLAEQIQEAENHAISLSEVFARISKKQIPFEMVEEAFKRMTSEGGKFYNMQEVLVNTLQGKIGKLRDVWQQALYDIGQSNSGLLKGAVDTITNLVSSLSKVGDEIGALIHGVGIYAAALTTLGALAGVVFGVRMILNIKAVVAELWAATTAATALSGAMGAIKAISIALAAVASVAILVAQKIKSAREEQERYNNAVAECTGNISQEISELDRLKRIAGDEKRSLDDRKRAIDAINQQYGSYLNNMGAEKVSVDNLTTSYNNLRDAIANKYLEELKEQTVGAKRTNLNNAENELVKFNYELIQKAGAGINDVVMGGLVRDIQEAITNRAPRSKAQNIYNVIAAKYAERGIDLEGKDPNRLLGLIENMVDASEQLKDSERRFDDFAKGYANSMGVVLKTNAELKNEEVVTPSTWGDNNNGNNNKAVQQAKDNINTVIDSIKELQRAYKDYKKMGLDDESILKIFGDDKMFGYLDEKLRSRLDYWDMLFEQAKEMEKYDPNEAKRIRADAARGKADEEKELWQQRKKDAEEAAKSLDKYLEALDKWTEQNQEISGTGAALGISKAIATYKKALAEADRKSGSMIKDLMYGTADDNQRLLGLGRINKQWGIARINALVNLRDSITKYADDIFKKQMQGYDLTNWNDKTLEQINDIKEAIKNVGITEEIENAFKELENGEELLALLKEEIENLKQEKIDKTVDPERFKKIAKQSKYIAQQFLKVADSLKAYADASGNQSLSDAAIAVGAIAQNLKAAEEGYKAWGGWWGAVIGGGTDLITQITDAVTVGEKALSEYEDTLKKVQETARVSSFKDSLSGPDNIFGESAGSKLKEAREQLEQIGEEIEILVGKNIGTKKTSWWERFLATINGEKVQDFKEWGKVLDLMEKNGLTTYDVNGVLNKESVQALIDLYGDADGTLQKLIDDIEIYYNALNEVQKAMQDVFGDIASSAADKIVEQWVEAGNAALDYAEILDDVAKSYAKMLVESAIIDKVLNKKEADRVADMFINGRTDEAMSAIAEDMQKIADMEPLFNEIMQVFDPYFNRTSEGSSESNSLGSGIKSITEDTANLLASYINAIRADVSVIRGLQEKGWEGIGLLGASVPSLNEHLAKVEANTYDTAQATQSVLSELRSVIGAPGTSGMVVRVEAY